MKKIQCPPRKQCVVKRQTGESQLYDERKLYGSVYAACYVAKLHDKDCEKIAEKVTTVVTKSVKQKKQVSAVAIKSNALRELKKHNKEAAFLYETHEDIS